MMKKFDRITLQVAESYLLHNKWCIESLLDDDYMIDDVHRSIFEESGLSIVEYFHVIPHAATKQTIREKVILTVYMKPDFTDFYGIITSTTDLNYDIHSNTFHTMDAAEPIYNFAPHVLQAFIIESAYIMKELIKELANCGIEIQALKDASDKKRTMDNELPSNQCVITMDSPLVLESGIMGPVA